MCVGYGKIIGVSRAVFDFTDAYYPCPVCMSSLYAEYEGLKDTLTWFTNLRKEGETESVQLEVLYNALPYTLSDSAFLARIKFRNVPVAVKNDVIHFVAETQQLTDAFLLETRPYSKYEELPAVYGVINMYSWILMRASTHAKGPKRIEAYTDVLPYAKTKRYGIVSVALPAHRAHCVSNQAHFVETPFLLTEFHLEAAMSFTQDGLGLEEAVRTALSV